MKEKRTLLKASSVLIFLFLCILPIFSENFANKLNQAINQQDVVEVQSLINNGSDPNFVEYSYLGSSLHLAAQIGNVKIGEILLKGGALINLQNQSGRTPLHEAIFSRKVDFADFLLKNKTDLFIQDNLGWTPLHISVFRRDLKTAKTILDAGFNPNFVNSRLQSAIFGANLDLAKLLLSYGADFNLVNKDGYPVIFCVDEETSIYLINRGANAFAKTPENETLLHVAGKSGWTPKGAEFLIKKGLNINAQDKRGRTPLLIAVQFSSPSSGLVDFLYSNGADGSITDNSGKSPDSVIRNMKINESLKLIKETIQNVFSF